MNQCLTTMAASVDVNKELTWTWCYTCFCVVLFVDFFCTGHFVIVPWFLICLHCWQHSYFENHFNYMNWSDFQKKNVVSNVDISRIKALWQNGLYTARWSSTTTTTTITTSTKTTTTTTTATTTITTVVFKRSYRWWWRAK